MYLLPLKYASKAAFMIIKVMKSVLYHQWDKSVFYGWKNHQLFLRALNILFICQPSETGSPYQILYLCMNLKIANFQKVWR